jgi:hypothetical protein
MSLALCLRIAFSDDNTPGVPDNSAGPYSPAPSPYRPGYPGGSYGIVPPGPERPLDSVRPSSWPGGAPSPLPGSQSQYAPPQYQMQPGQPFPGQPGQPAIEAGIVCQGSQILARLGSDIVLGGDLLAGIDDWADRAAGKDKMSPAKYDEQRRKLTAEIIAAIDDLAAHSNDPDPLANVDMQSIVIVRQLLVEHVKTMLVYNDARHKLPEEAWTHIEEDLAKEFEKSELDRLLKLSGVQSREELDRKLRTMGSSLEREKRAFAQRTLSRQWMREQIKFDDEITHEEMVSWYQTHLSVFETPARARWEELMVRISKYPSKADAMAAIARMGDQVVLGGTPLSQVAKAQSDGSTAADGGLHKWVSKGSLKAKEVDLALFGLPINQLSPILESNGCFYIVRVLGREDVTRKPFAAVQDDVKEKIREERTEKKLAEYMARIKKQVPIWTIFDDPRASAAQLSSHAQPPR